MAEQVTLPGGETVPLEEIAAVWRLLQGQVAVTWIGRGGSHGYEAIRIGPPVEKETQAEGPTPWAALVALAAKVEP